MSTTPEFKTMAERMRHAWEQSGKTQTEIAEHCGVERQTVNKWMPPDPSTPFNMPLGENLRRFAEVTGFSTGWLLASDGPMRSDDEAAKSPLAVSKAAQLLQCLEMVEAHPVISKFKLEDEVKIDLAKRLQRTLKSDGSFDPSKVIEVIANPFLKELGASGKNTNNDVKKKQKGD